MPDQIPELVTFYSENLRGSMFSAFMTLTGFLFTLHAFLLVTLYRDIYSKQEYREWVVNEGRKYNPKLKPNQPLRNISRLLFVALGFSFTTGVLQLTVGLIAKTWAVWICIGSAVITGLVFCYVLLVFRVIIANWLNFIDKEAESAAANGGS